MCQVFYDRNFIAAKLCKWEQYLRDYALPAWEALPSIELYMDQVVALVTQYLDFLPADEQEERLITASTINNYVRMKIMPAPKKKKYSRIHLAYLIMICTLKQSLNIAYIQKMIPMGLGEDEVRVLYNSYVEKHRAASQFFVRQVREAAAHVLDPADSTENAVGDLVSSVAVAAGFSKLLAEKIVELQNRNFENTDDPALTPPGQ